MSTPPITKLPAEVLAKIFLYVFPRPIDFSWDDFSYRLETLQVCRQWQSVALGQPFLWNNIRIVNPVKNSSTLERAHKCLRLTKEAPLSIRLMGLRNSIPKFLKPYSKRIIRLEIYAMYPRLRALLRMPADSFPSLRHLLIRVDGGATEDVPEDVRVFHGAFNMRSIDIRQPTHRLIGFSIPLSQIHDLKLEIETHVPLETFLDDLRSCINLRSCTLTLESHQGEAGFVEMPHLKSLELGTTRWCREIKTSVPIVAPALEELKVTSEYWPPHVLADFIIRSGCTILRLALDGVPESFLNYFAEQMRLPSLQVLEIHYITLSNMKAVSTARTFPELRLLKCTSQNYGMLCELSNTLVSRVLSRGASTPHHRMDVDITAFLYYHTFTKSPAMKWLAANGVHLHVRIERLFNPDPMLAVCCDIDFSLPQ